MTGWDKLTSTQIGSTGGIDISSEDAAADIEIDDVEDALRRADELAELTGRSKADVIADLLDDGQLNQSAGEDTKEQKDFLDVAQEKAEKLKTLLITIAPIIALLSGIGLEGLGVLDVTAWGSDSVWEDGDPQHPDDNFHIDTDIWGCTAWDAENFNPNANRDDGSCYWDNSPPPVYGCMDYYAENYDEQATEDDGSCYYPPADPCDGATVEASQDPKFRWIGQQEGNAEVVFYLYHTGAADAGLCEFQVEVMISLYHDNGYQLTIEFDEAGMHVVNDDYNGEFEIRNGRLNNLGEGEWSVETRWRIIGEPENCCIMSDTLTIEPEPEPEPETHCDEGDISLSDFWSNVRPDNTSVRVLFKINIADGEEVDCTGSFFEIEVRLENSGQVLAGPTNLSELISENSREFAVVFEDLQPGDHAPGVWVRYQGELVAQNWLWTVTVPEPEPVECAADFFEFIMSYQDNNTEALKLYTDPDEINDCGEQITVDVVWTIFDANGTETQLGYRLNTTGVDWDQMWLYTENLTLGNYTVELELFLVKDGERSAEPCKTYEWINIEIKENETDE